VAPTCENVIDGTTGNAELQLGIHHADTFSMTLEGNSAVRDVNTPATEAFAFRQEEMPSWSSAVPGPAI